MPKTKKQIGIIIAAIIILILAGNIALGTYLVDKKQETEVKIIPPTSSDSASIILDQFSYDGKEGIDALTLLKEKATVEESQPGMVSSIDGRSAASANKEFWAFYVNGQMAQVGAADYQTKAGDKIEWRIEFY